MKKNTKSSITLPQKELELVNGLVKTLGEKSKVAVIRRGLYLLKSQTDRAALKIAYANASSKAGKSSQEDLDDLDHLAGEGID